MERALQHRPFLGGQPEICGGEAPEGSPVRGAGWEGLEIGVDLGHHVLVNGRNLPTEGVVSNAKDDTTTATEALSRAARR